MGSLPPRGLRNVVQADVCPCWRSRRLDGGQDWAAGHGEGRLLGPSSHQDSDGRRGWSAIWAAELMQWLGRVGSDVCCCWWNPTFQSSDRVVVRVSSVRLYLSVLGFFEDVAALGVVIVDIHLLGRRLLGSWSIRRVRKALLVYPVLS